jgi:hypothetical protein
MPILIFPPRFHAAIIGGTKTHTVRAPRARPVRVGDTLSLRPWIAAAAIQAARGVPAVLAPVVCTRLTLLRMTRIASARPGARWGVDHHLAIDCLIHRSVPGDAITAGECRSAPAMPGTRLDRAQTDDVARRDGFAEAGGLLAWMRQDHGNDLDHGITGICIGWDGPWT